MALSSNMSSSMPFHGMPSAILSTLMDGGDASVSAMVLASLGNSPISSSRTTSRSNHIPSAPIVSPVTVDSNFPLGSQANSFSATALSNQLAIDLVNGRNLLTPPNIVPMNVLSSGQDSMMAMLNFQAVTGATRPTQHLNSEVPRQKQLPIKKSLAARKHRSLQRYSYNSSIPPVSPFSYHEVPAYATPPSQSATPADAEARDETERKASTSTRKRASRQCRAEGCTNTVVQGGVCISHGAKRKQCKMPGCTKSVKKAGLCSAHGPARKKCEHTGCPNTAVQGGLCISHGARKRLCSISGCAKKGKAAWKYMCKRHFDLTSTMAAHNSPCTSASTAMQCQIIQKGNA